MTAIVAGRPLPSRGSSTADDAAGLVVAQTLRAPETLEGLLTPIALNPDPMLDVWSNVQAVLDTGSLHRRVLGAEPSSEGIA
jgi:hypothetical protein